MNIITMKNPEGGPPIEMVMLEELQPIIDRQENLIAAYNNLLSANKKLLEANQKLGEVATELKKRLEEQ